MASIVLKLFERISYLLRAAFRCRFASRVTSIRRLRRGLAGRRQHGWVQRAEYFSKLFARLAGIRRLRAFLSVFGPISALFFTCLQLAWWLFGACFALGPRQFPYGLRQFNNSFHRRRYRQRDPHDRQRPACRARSSS
ncbi:hypothetical protein [Paraburkholderia domus]|uniref:hypothetical protein n=1 Tax=Paraburkholderia domus TaxID=2793075 RepID=UPI001912602E|nr:hypothetical protein [Paraburkholderia domus]MBK5166981.1 hypothetical protein [Burkholderia sp. R-70211]MCI0146617.1 hypothetical protein [Paraburkholderia sediminicola]